MLDKVERMLKKILKIGTLWSTVGLILCVLLQIFARFFLESAPPWTEEASRGFFIYSVAFAAGLALDQNYFVSIEYFFNKFSSKIQRILQMLIAAVIFIAFFIISIYAIRFAINGHIEYSPSMKVRMSTMFFSMTILSITLSFYSFRQLIQTINRR